MVGIKTWGKVSSITLLVLIWCLVTVLIVLSAKARADDQSAWLSMNNPTLEFIRDIPPSELLPSTINGNRDCQKREILTRESRPWIFQERASFDGCAVDAQYGTAASGYLKRPGTNMFGRTISAVSGQPVNIVAIPGSSMLIQYSSSQSYGVNISIRPGEASIQKSSAHLVTGAVTHEFTSAEPSHRIRYVSGNTIPIILESIAFSTNGKWLVGDVSNVGKVRVNLETREVLLFGSKMQYGLGFDPTPQMTVSGDGRYVIAAAVQHNFFFIYDLSTCLPEASQSSSTGLQRCDSKDLLPFIRSQIPGLSGVSTIRFRSDYTFDFYTFIGSGSSAIRKHYILTAPGHQRILFEYLALGDSFASGEGAHVYKTFTNTDNNKCHLSQVSYPYLIGQTLELDSYESVACSGAKIEDLISIDKEYEGQENEKIHRDKRDISPILNKFLTGKIAQQEFVERYKPSVITLSAGGNDVGFTGKVSRCVLLPDTCFKNYEDRLESLNEINDKFYELVNMYSTVKKLADPGAKVYVVGYPQIANPEGNCGANVHMNKEELIFAWDYINYLNDVILTATLNAGVSYVDVSAAFKGYRLCESNDKKGFAVNGLTAGDDRILGTIGNESYHPTALGHELLRDTILWQTANLTEKAAPADPSAIVYEPHSSLPVLDAQKRNRPVRSIKQLDKPVIVSSEGLRSNSGQNLIQTGSTVELKPSTSDVRLEPNSQVEVWLHSDPLFLGIAKTDSQGNIPAIEVMIPEDTPLGYHTLYFYAKNTSSQDVALYQEVFVIANFEDFDGDGILNEDEPCLVVEPANQDLDSDGIDDACDDVIEERPEEENQEEAETPPAPSDQIEMPLPEDNDDQADEEPTITTPEPQPFVNQPQVATVTAINNSLATRPTQQSRQPDQENNAQVLSDTTESATTESLRAGAEENEFLSKASEPQKTAEGTLLSKILLISLLTLSCLTAYLFYRRAKTN